MSHVTVNQFDVGVPFTDALTADDVPVDLTTATSVHFVLRNANGDLLVDAAATITDAANGEIEYVSTVGDFALAGHHRQHWIVTYPGPVIETYPSVGYNTVTVVDPDAPLGPSSGPCDPWVTWDDLSDYCIVPDNVSAVMQEGILASVTRLLWQRSCKQFGLCTMTARPVPCCAAHRRPFCSCGRYDAITLGTAPIAGIVSIEIDGDVLDSSAYRVDEFQWLVRVDGNSWPRCNDLSVADGEDGTFVVEWTYGVAVPPEGIMAAALMACKQATDFTAGDCEIPANTTQVDREGIHIVIEPPVGNTGIAFAEQWLSSFHCGGGRIFDAGVRPDVMRVGT